MSDTRKVVVNGTEYEVALEHEGTTWTATVEGDTFVIEMPDVQATAKPRRAGGRKKKKSGTVSANIPGKVVTVEVEEGQEVVEGQVILILEAMKMQNEIKLPSRVRSPPFTAVKVRPSKQMYRWWLSNRLQPRMKMHNAGCGQGLM